jgi:hypothetical protein
VRVCFCACEHWRHTSEISSARINTICRRKHSGLHKQKNLDCPLSGVGYFPDLQVVVDLQKEEERLYGVACVFERSVVAVRNSLHMISG